MNKIIQIARVVFIVILVFSYPISFLDSFNSDIFSNFINIYYFLKKVLLVVVVATLFSSSKELPSIVKMFIFGSLFFVISYLIYSARRLWLTECVFDYFCCFTVFGAVLKCYSIWNRVVNVLVWGSRVFCVLICYALFTQLDVDMSFFLSKNYMFFSNAMVIPCAILMYSAIVTKKFIDIPLSICCCLLLLLGSRGSLLSMMLLAGALVLRSQKTSSIFFICVIITILFLILNVLTSSGVIVVEDSRAFNFLKSGTNFVNEDRFDIWKQVINETNPILGGGYLSDRDILSHRYGITEDVAYAHNIFIELYTDLGIIGFGLAIYLYFQFAKQMIRRSSYQYLFVTFFFISAFPLFFSRTVFLEPNFFILLGMLFMSKKESDVLDSKCSVIPIAQLNDVKN